MNLINTVLEQINATAGTELEKQTGLPKTQITEAMKVLAGIFSHQIVNNNDTSNFLNAVKSHTVTANDWWFDLEDGAKILSHLFWEKTDAVSHAFGEQIGTDLGNTNTLMQAAASMFMDQLSQTQKHNNIAENTLIQALTGASSDARQHSNIVSSILTNVLDTDHDGSIADDIMAKGLDMAKNMMKKSA